MSPIGHLAMGFAAKTAGLKVSLGVLLAASWLLDIPTLYSPLRVLKLKILPNLAWFPPLFRMACLMAVVWSVLAGVLAWQVYRSQQAGMVIGLVVFSRSALDFISWNNLYLFFEGSPRWDGLSIRWAEPSPWLR